MTNETALTDEQIKTAFTICGGDEGEIPFHAFRTVVNALIQADRAKFIANGGWIAERKPIEDYVCNNPVCKNILVEMPSGKVTYARLYQGKKVGWWGYDGSRLKSEPVAYYELPQKAGE